MIVNGIGDKLKTCPFCGGRAYARWDPGKGSFGYASVECRACGAVPYIHNAYSGLNKEDAVRGVVEAWNRRANGDKDEFGRKNDG